MTEDEFYVIVRKIALIEKDISDKQTELHGLTLQLFQELVNRIRYGRP